jgi:hypothetical protein
MIGVTPPGMEKVVKKLKQQPGVDNPWKIAWSIYKKRGSAAAEILDDELESEITAWMAEQGLAASGPTIAETIRTQTEFAVGTGQKMGKAAADYVEVPGGTNCATCVFAQRLDPEITNWNEDIADCAIMSGRISLGNGCCAAWTSDPNQLRAVSDQ